MVQRIKDAGDVSNVNYILIIEDDAALSNGIVYALKDDNFAFIQAFDLATAKNRLKAILLI